MSHRIAPGLCALLLGACFAPIEHHLDVGVAGYRVHDGGGARGVEGMVGGGVGMGCRERHGSVFLRGEGAGGYDEELTEWSAAARAGLGYRHRFDAALFETSATAGPIRGGWGDGLGGVLSAGFGVKLGLVDDGPTYDGFHWVMVEAVADARRLERTDGAMAEESERQIFYGIRVRYIRQRLPSCYGAGG